jgi:hypothetical protein
VFNPTACKATQTHTRSSTDLGLQSPTEIDSCPFVFIRGSNTTPCDYP